MSHRNYGLLAALTLTIVSLVGCGPYQEPVHEELGTSETGFLVKLEGATEQGKFDSEAYLEELKVAAKRIEIPTTKRDTGRWWMDYKWVPTHRLIKVDRSPVTRTWTSDTDSGTSSKDEAIWVESKDSVGFSTGITLTAMIKEPDAAKFLYFYPSGSLAIVMDNEIRARVQKVFSEQAASFDMSDLRAQKTVIVKAIETDVTQFFADRGITITTVGMTGGFAYENELIQKKIDEVFIAQREKEVAKAMLDAQADKNAKIELEAKALANAAEEKARGEADGQKLILAVAKEAAQDPVFLQLKQLEVESQRIEKWDGSYPQFMMSGAGGTPNFFMPLPGPNQDRPSTAGQPLRSLVQPTAQNN